MRIKKWGWKAMGFSSNKQARISYGWDYNKGKYAKTKAGKMLFANDKRMGYLK